MEIRDGEAAWFCCSLHARAATRIEGSGVECRGSLDSNRRLSKANVPLSDSTNGQVVKSARARSLLDRPHF
jgi:hypothetical protein